MHVVAEGSRDMQSSSSDVLVRSGSELCEMTEDSVVDGQYSNDMEADQLTRYPFIFPSNYDTSKAVILECDPEASPYAERDVLFAIKDLPEAKNIRYVGAMSLNYVKVVVFNAVIDAETFSRRRQISVKGKVARIARMATNNEIAIQISWLPPDVSDEAVAQKLQEYGKVIKTVRVKCAIPDLPPVETTTRIIILDKKSTVQLTNIPYITRIRGFRVALSIRNRPPMCYRCHQIGHFRRICTTVKCGKCNRYGHMAEQCTGPTFATVVESTLWPTMEHSQAEIIEPTKEPTFEPNSSQENSKSADLGGDMANDGSTAVGHFETDVPDSAAITSGMADQDERDIVSVAKAIRGRSRSPVRRQARTDTSTASTKGRGESIEKIVAALSQTSSTPEKLISITKGDNDGVLSEDADSGGRVQSGFRRMSQRLSRKEGLTRVNSSTSESTVNAIEVLNANRFSPLESECQDH